ncbi:MAG TPA: hypothetical protein VGN72_16685 [Tepidisphaeraceae bacterium]|nr:hypothetical protein [Tepidisphaeraceae bacterium]
MRDQSPHSANGTSHKATDVSPPMEMLEIDTAQSKRWRGLAIWVILVVFVGTLLGTLFMRFTGSMRLAILLVAFMMTYMGVMGWLASRKGRAD